MAKRTIKEDLEEVMTVLYAMQYHIEQQQPYPKSLIDKAYSVWAKLWDWKTDDPKCQKDLDFFRNLLLDQIEVNEILVLEAEIKEHKDKCKEATRKLNKILSRELPDQQTSLTTS